MPWILKSTRLSDCARFLTTMEVDMEVPITGLTQDGSDISVTSVFGTMQFDRINKAEIVSGLRNLADFIERNIA
jgi:hypothetical protein